VGGTWGKISAAVVGGAGGLALGLLDEFLSFARRYEQRWVNIAQALRRAASSQNFLYTAIDDPEHNLFNWIASAWRFC